MAASEVLLTRRDFLGAGLLLLSPFQFAPIPSGVEFLSYDRAAPVVRSKGVLLPDPIGSLNDDGRRRLWNSWVRERDRAIRSRLLRGEEDTLVNFILFGVSFTNQPRLTPAMVANADLAQVEINARLRDFLKGVLIPGTNERLLVLKSMVNRLGYNADTPERRTKLEEYVKGEVLRYITEQQEYRRTLGRALQNDTASSTDLTANFYKDRGLSVDTDFRPNFGIEQALRDRQRRGLLPPIRRVAIIGPGLDFTDKDSGFDYYPLQTLQPFAVIDSLLRLGVAKAPNLQVTLFDISTMTLDHVSEAVKRARGGQPYTLQLVLDQTRQWNPAAAAYWRRFGDQIGALTDPLPPPPQIRNVDRRAIRIRPEIVLMLNTRPLNVVLQHARPSPQFDLIIGTNILVYYQRFEQALAMLNIESMLSQSGLFLSNDVADDFQGVGLHPIGNVQVEYADRSADAMTTYSRSPFVPQLGPR